MKDERSALDAPTSITMQPTKNEYGLDFTNLESCISGLAAGPQALPEQNLRPLRQEVEEKLHTNLARNALQGSAQDSITGIESQSLSALGYGKSIWSQFGEADGLGPFWDIRYTLSLDTSNTDSKVDYSALKDGVIAAKEGARLEFKVEMYGKLYNGGFYNTTSQQQQRLQELFDSIRPPEGGWNQDAVSAYNKEKYPSKLPKRPSGGAVFISTKALNSDGTKNSNWATQSLDYQAVGELFGIKHDNNLESNEYFVMGSNKFAVEIKSDDIIEPTNEVFLVQMQQDQSALAAVNNYVQQLEIHIIDDTKLPSIPLDFKFSKSQRELLGVLARDANFDDYIGNLESVVGDMVDDKSSSVVIEMQTRVLELYGEAVDGNLKISLQKFISSSSIASSIIEAAVAEYITKPQARAALGRLKSVKDKLIKAEVEALLIEHGYAKLTASGSPAANAAIQHYLAKFKSLISR